MRDEQKDRLIDREILKHPRNKTHDSRSAAGERGSGLRTRAIGAKLRQGNGALALSDQTKLFILVPRFKALL
jgi:hypothetical protein